MRIAVSNIAWDSAEDDEIGALLLGLGIDAVDVAPAKYFPRPREAKTQEVVCVKQQWRDRGFDIVGMQALMFGTSGLNLFGPPEVQATMLSHLEQVARIGASLNARRLVFGSPRNRDRQGLDATQTDDIAMDFFNRLGDIGSREGVVFCLEPNPESYNCNFLTTTSDALDFVRRLNHPAVRLQLDLGAVTMNSEDPDVVISAASDWIGHVHISEPGLAPIGDAGTDHGRLSKALYRSGGGGQIGTIEMVATQNERHVLSVARACHVALESYRSRSDEGMWL